MENEIKILELYNILKKEKSEWTFYITTKHKLIVYTHLPKDNLSEAKDYFSEITKKLELEYKIDNNNVFVIS